MRLIALLLLGAALLWSGCGTLAPDPSSAAPRNDPAPDRPGAWQNWGS